MRRFDSFIKRLMYAGSSSVKNKHASAFLRYNSRAKLKNLVRVETAIRTGKVRDFGYPYMLTVEPTNRCNLRCPLCPTGRGLPGRPLQTLDMAAFERILEEVGPYVYMINFQNWGEPTLAKQLPEMIAKAHQAHIATTVATNGNYSPKLNAKLIESGLDNVMVAIDGATQESYEKYRVQGRLETVKENVRQLVEARNGAGKRRPYVEIQFLVFEYNRHEIPEIRRLADECRADGLLIRAAVAPGNASNRKKFYTWNEERNFCRRFWYTASINADLGLTPCCNFFFREDDLGNIGAGSFDAVWNGENYVRNRAAVVNRDFEHLHANCKACKKYSGKLGCEAYGVEGAQVDAAWNAPTADALEAPGPLVQIELPR
jgi:MoaA/NifB/PqqE/SkfB family radical SAM enzyme